MDPHCKLNVATNHKSLSLDTAPTKPMSLVNKVTSGALFSYPEAEGQYRKCG